MARDRPTLAEIGITPALAEALESAGLVVVPLIPTEQMIEAAWASTLDENAKLVWEDMIAAWRGTKG